eukprot:234296-Hanusia_phi.AAC.1
MQPRHLLLVADPAGALAPVGRHAGPLGVPRTAALDQGLKAQVGSDLPSALAQPQPALPKLLELLGVVGVSPAPVAEEVARGRALGKVHLPEARGERAAVAYLGEAVALERLVELHLAQPEASCRLVVAANGCGDALLEALVHGQFSLARDEEVVECGHDPGDLHRKSVRERRERGGRLGLTACAKETATDLDSGEAEGRTMG